MILCHDKVRDSMVRNGEQEGIAVYYRYSLIIRWLTSFSIPDYGIESMLLNSNTLIINKNNTLL